MNLNQVTISSVNVEKATKFYELLGLKLIVDAIPKYVRFECPDGDCTFSIHQVDELHQTQETTIYFEEEDLEGLVNRLKEYGVIFDSPIQEKPWLWRETSLQDPDGNSIILYHAGKYRKIHHGA